MGIDIETIFDLGNKTSSSDANEEKEESQE